MILMQRCRVRRIYLSETMKGKRRKAAETRKMQVARADRAPIWKRMTVVTVVEG